MKVWFLIPARGGSKTIPKKNIRHLAGKPLILHSLDTIGKMARPEQIIVSTDDDNIKALVEGRAVIHDRSGENANDVATLDDVAVEVSKFLLNNGGNENDHENQPLARIVYQAPQRKEGGRSTGKQRIYGVLSVEEG